MKSTWKIVKLEEVCVKTTSGGTPNRAIKEFWNGDIPWIKSGELNDDIVVEHEETITRKGLENSSAKIFPKGTLLLALYGATAGKLGFLGIEAATNQAICAIFNDENLITKNFIYYFLLCNREKIVQDSFGGAQPNISQNYVRNLSIPLPPLETQKKIVEKIDAAFARLDEAIQLQQQNIQRAENLKKSVLEEVFGGENKSWTRTKVGNAIDSIQTGTTPTMQEPRYYEIPSYDWFAPSDFDGKKELNNSKRKLDIRAIEEGKARIYPENSLLLVAIGATVGKIGISRIPTSSNQQITGIKFSYNILVDFAYYQFLYIKDLIISEASAATLPIINQNGIKKLPFKFPLDIKIQHQIVAYLDETFRAADKLLAEQRQRLAHLEAMKKSILEAAFQGAL
ncbi:MAG: restriction endonuclease subunit S [Chitinophagales bacterium]|nr:restriction endonuclease subunit S [Chitinophagales bacterium]